MKARIFCPFFLWVVLIIAVGCKEETIVDAAAIAHQYNEKGTNFLATNQWDSAFYYYNKSKNEAVDQSSEQYAYTLLQIATIQQNNGDLSGCEETLTEALANYKGSTYLPYFYNMLAIAYDKQKDAAHAIDYYTKAFEKIPDSLNKAIIQNNIALVYLQNGDYHKAVGILETIVTKPKIQENELEYARVLDNLGYAYFRLNNQKGIKLLEKSLQIRERLQEPNGLLTSYMHLSEYYQSEKPQEAEKYGLLAYETSKKVSSPDDQLEALKWLIENSSPNLAKDYSKSYFKLNESINVNRTKAKNQFAKIKYDSKKATLEVIKYKNKNLFLVALLAFFVLVVVLLYFLYQSMTKRKLLKSAYQTETRISKRIHDELANDVFNAMTFTQTKDLQNSSTKESLLDTLESIYQKARDISKENSNIRTDEHFETDLFQLLQTFSNNQVSVIVQTKNDILWSKLVPEKKIALFRVLQELLINTKKHSQASIVIVAFQNQSKTVQIDYTDNVLGVDLTTSKKTGLQNAEIRISAIQGTLTFDTQINKGFRAQLIIPT